MNRRRQQLGMSLLGMLIIVIMAGFFVMSAIRMAPAYFEYLSVRDIISRTAVDPESADENIGDIRRKFQAIFHTNQITWLKAQEVDIFRKDGKTYIDARYEVRLPMFWRIDAVLKFDDLFYAVGEAEPVDPAVASNRP